MKNMKKVLALTAGLSIIGSMTACGNNDDSSGHGYLMEQSETTPPVTVAINTETLAPEQEEQVQDLADSLTDAELENKTVKWLSFYDPWHPTGQGNSKPVSTELFEKSTAEKFSIIRQHGQINTVICLRLFSAVKALTFFLLPKRSRNVLLTV